MTEVTETELIYLSPDIEISSFETEGVLCMSVTLPDWEENEDIL